MPELPGAPDWTIRTRRDGKTSLTVTVVADTATDIYGQLWKWLRAMDGARTRGEGEAG